MQKENRLLFMAIEEQKYWQSEQECRIDDIKDQCRKKLGKLDENNPLRAEKIQNKPLSAEKLTWIETSPWKLRIFTKWNPIDFTDISNIPWLILSDTSKYMNSQVVENFRRIFEEYSKKPWKEPIVLTWTTRSFSEQKKLFEDYKKWEIKELIREAWNSSHHLWIAFEVKKPIDPEFKKIAERFGFLSDIPGNPTYFYYAKIKRNPVIAKEIALALDRYWWEKTYKTSEKKKNESTLEVWSIQWQLKEEDNSKKTEDWDTWENSFDRWNAPEIAPLKRRDLMAKKANDILQWRRQIEINFWKKWEYLSYINIQNIPGLEFWNCRPFLNREIANKFVELILTYHSVTWKNITINSATRTYQDQQEIKEWWNTYTTADPWNSSHHLWLAFDIQEPIDSRFIKLAKSFWFENDIPGDPIHFYHKAILSKMQWWNTVTIAKRLDFAKKNFPRTNANTV